MAAPYTPYEAGKLGEIICLYKLLQIPVEARLVEMGTYDVVADHEGQLIRIQVKTSQLKRNKDARGYQFCITKGSANKRPLSAYDCDIVALVGIEQENCMFMPVWEVASCKTKRIQPVDFLHPSLARETWEKSVTKAILSPARQEPHQQCQSSTEAL